MFAIDTHMNQVANGMQKTASDRRYILDANVTVVGPSSLHRDYSVMKIEATSTIRQRLLSAVAVL